MAIKNRSESNRIESNPKLWTNDNDNDDDDESMDENKQTKRSNKTLQIGTLENKKKTKRKPNFDKNFFQPRIFYIHTITFYLYLFGENERDRQRKTITRIKRDREKI